MLKTQVKLLLGLYFTHSIFHTLVHTFDSRTTRYIQISNPKPGSVSNLSSTVERKVSPFFDFTNSSERSNKSSFTFGNYSQKNQRIYYLSHLDPPTQACSNTFLDFTNSSERSYKSSFTFGNCSQKNQRIYSLSHSYPPTQSCSTLRELKSKHSSIY